MTTGELCCICGVPLPPGAGRFLFDERLAVCMVCHDAGRRPAPPPAVPPLKG